MLLGTVAMVSIYNPAHCNGKGEANKVTRRRWGKDHDVISDFGQVCGSVFPNVAEDVAPSHIAIGSFHNYLITLSTALKVLPYTVGVKSIDPNIKKFLPSPKQGKSSKDIIYTDGFTILINGIDSVAQSMNTSH